MPVEHIVSPETLRMNLRESGRFIGQQIDGDGSLPIRPAGAFSVGNPVDSC
jgi:hypothetical protein